MDRETYDRYVEGDEKTRKRIELDNLLSQALDGVIECPRCGNNLEPDAKKCVCGWKNPLRGLGLI